jgi:hypothetical protein
MVVSRPGGSLPNEGREGIKPATLQHRNTLCGQNAEFSVLQQVVHIVTTRVNTTRTTLEKTRPAILLLLRVYSLPR